MCNNCLVLVFLKCLGKGKDDPVACAGSVIGVLGGLVEVADGVSDIIFRSGNRIEDLDSTGCLLSLRYGHLDSCSVRCATKLSLMRKMPMSIV